ncbi:MAG: InlB B-repeat-containing protein [Clostridiales bacterium]|nr:InlB B-repeat-containing protein [Clostridiales bacterium]
MTSIYMAPFSVLADETMPILTIAEDGKTEEGLTLEKAESDAKIAFEETGARGIGETRPFRDFPAAGKVSIRETGTFYDTLYDAFEAAKDAGPVTIEIHEDFSETRFILVSPDTDVTIVGVCGAHTIQLRSSILVLGEGARLVLGDGTKDNIVTLSSDSQTMEVSGGGEIEIHDGIKLINITDTSYALKLSGREGKAASATITGGILQGRNALEVENGARIHVISGGEFLGSQHSVSMTSDTNNFFGNKGMTTSIGAITGGRFIKTAPTYNSTAFVVQNESYIGEISGGYFESDSRPVLGVYRGTRIDAISGGEFVTRENNSTNHGGIHVVSDVGLPYPVETSIGTISGLTVSGGYVGLLVSGQGARIGAITGGRFEATMALLNGYDGLINEISGGYFIGEGNQTLFAEGTGVYNAGTIEKLGGESLYISGYRGPGIDNEPRGKIVEISGGTILNVSYSYGIRNRGEIDILSGGQIFGNYAAVSSEPIYTGEPAQIGRITGGVFYGENEPAILLSSKTLIEPGLDEKIGFARFWGKDGAVFGKSEGTLAVEDASMAVFPKNSTLNEFYYMSTETLPVEGINGAAFKYLKLPASYVDLTFDTNGGSFAGGEITDVRTVEAGTALGGNMPDDPKRDGHAFLGWNTDKEGKGYSFTGDTIIHVSMTVYAQWNKLPVTSKVKVIDSYAEYSGAGLYAEGRTVAINAGSRKGYVFLGWTVEEGGVVLAEDSEATTSFVMPDKDVTVKAHWEESRSLQYKVTVKNSFAVDGSMGAFAEGPSITGEGVYDEGVTVTIRAGSQSGYTFAGWTIDEGGAVLDDTGKNSAIANFIMPAMDVTVTATWKPNGGTTDPGTTDPGTTGPGTTDPKPTDPGTTDPKPTDPEVKTPEPGTPDPEIRPDPEPIEPTAPPPDPISPEDTIVPADEDNTFVELNGNGTPTGEWRWDDDTDTWIFIAYPPPTGSLPKTGYPGMTMELYVLYASVLITMAVTVRGRRKRQRGMH